jgi:hypothetical protein
MTMPDNPFASPETLRKTFVAGLANLLEQPGLGAYVLVLANASLDPGVREALGRRLGERFETLAGEVRKALAGGREPQEAPDDLMVFLKLMAIGFDRVRDTETRHAGPWEVQFNQVRAFRPKRMTATRCTGMQAPFDPSGFHFNKPFLRRETFWSGRLQGLDVDLLYNKFPFAELHGLLVPNRDANLPQFLGQPYHYALWDLTRALGEALPGVGFGYNSYGALASINHLHFQLFLRRTPLPVSLPHWTHNGGDRSYPGHCQVLHDPDRAWAYLDRLHHREVPYNLVYLPGALYCLPRIRQGELAPAPWTAGFAWYEMAGGVTTFNRADFEQLRETDIAAELARITVP